MCASRGKRWRPVQAESMPAACQVINCHVARHTHSLCPPACRWAPPPLPDSCNSAAHEHERARQKCGSGSCWMSAECIIQGAGLNHHTGQTTTHHPKCPTCSTAAFCCLTAGLSLLPLGWPCCPCRCFCSRSRCCLLNGSSKKVCAQSPWLSRSIDCWNQSRPWMPPCPSATSVSTGGVSGGCRDCAAAAALPARCCF